MIEQVPEGATRALKKTINLLAEPAQVLYSEWGSEVQKVVNPLILDDRKYIQNQGLAENISKT